MNRPECEEVRAQAIKSALEKNPNAFQPKLSNVDEVRSLSI